jgi:hypothetical protein
MVVVAHPIRFGEEDPRAMLRHLDQWARYSLGTPEAWASVVERCGQWADYSPRNQVLLASYGIVGPVAGAATWDRVPSTEPGRGCAIRSGEHGLLVRVPVVEAGDVQTDRTRQSASSESVAGSHRWEPVFAAEQLARRPAVGVLSQPAVKPMSDREWAEAVRVASGRMTGRTPRSVPDTTEQLASLAGRVSHGSGRVRLPAELAAQAAWLVEDRIGRTSGPMPTFDPAGLQSRERWQTAVDVRRSVDQVLSAVSFAVGIELTSSPLPRHELADDREVRAGRRNYLAPAEVRGLPLGVWVEAGPYKRAEWLGRGVAGATGVGAFMRVNDRSYLAVYETKGGALWRLETTGRGAHLGLIGEGTSTTLADGKRDVSAALAERFPDAAAAVEAVTTNRVASRSFGWAALPEGRDDRTQHRVFDDHVTAMIAPGPGGRWQTWVSIDGRQRQGPHAADSETARSVADGLARGALLEVAAATPARSDSMVRELAAAETWSRSDLVAVVGHRLTDSHRAELASTDDVGRLAELMRDTGVLAPSTMVEVLRCEQVDLDSVVRIAATIGMPTPDAIRAISHGWDTDRLTVGRALGADASELRAAGCTAVEMLAVAPREELRRLDERESTWALVAPTLVEAGYSVAEAVKHIALHAPTAATFAAAVETLVDVPSEAFSLAGRHAQPDDLAALSERYGLDVGETASALAAACVPIEKAVEAIAHRCDGDTDATASLAARHLGLLDLETVALLRGEPSADVAQLATGVYAVFEHAVDGSEAAMRLSMERA